MGSHAHLDIVLPVILGVTIFVVFIFCLVYFTKRRGICYNPGSDEGSLNHSVHVPAQSSMNQTLGTNETSPASAVPPQRLSTDKRQRDWGILLPCKDVLHLADKGIQFQIQLFHGKVQVYINPKVIRNEVWDEFGEEKLSIEAIITHVEVPSKVQKEFKNIGMDIYEVKSLKWKLMRADIQQIVKSHIDPEASKLPSRIYRQICKKMGL